MNRYVKALNFIKGTLSTFHQRTNSEVPKKETEWLNTLQELTDKATPKKPIEYEDKYYGCPCCDNNLMPKWLKYPTEPMPKSYGFAHCMSCGQALDWSEE